MNVDLLLDLSGVAPRQAAAREVLKHLGDPDGLAAITGRASCILPAGPGIPDSARRPHWRFHQAKDALAASSCALEAAARARRPLLVLMTPILTGSEPVSALLEALEVDPMFGFAVARVANKDGELAKLSSGLGDPEIDRIPRAVLNRLPENYIVPELVGVCFLVRREVVANFGALDARFETTAGAWLHYLCRARRAGFRGVIVNRAVVATVHSDSAATTIDVGRDYWTLHKQFPDAEYARQEFRRLPAHEYESLAARALSPDAKRKTLLIDARGMPPHYNGTAHCIVGVLDGMLLDTQGWRISVLAKPDAARFHRLRKRYPDWNIFEQPPADRFTAALRLSQPWDVPTLADLHSRALLNCCVMLDTISWDILYSTSISRSIETTWRLLARHADAIIHDSDYTRQRFVVRFPPSPWVRHHVCHYSFHPDEYAAPELKNSVQNEHLLIIGNELDHKWVNETTALLATAFPFCAFQALGYKGPDLPNVTALSSGHISDEEMAVLYATARMVLFPSFYEGFGFPVLQGLCYGKTVIARHSSLLEEVADRCRADGRLFAFSDTAELIEIVSRQLRGDDTGSLPLGQALRDGEEPMRWRDISRNMLRFVESSLEVPPYSRWLERAQALELQFGAGA